MSGKATVFDESSAAAIARTVRIVNRNHHVNPNDGTDVSGLIDDQSEFWAKITAATNVSGVYKHDWTEYRRTDIGFEAIPDNPRTGTSTEWPAIAPDGSQVTTNSYVRLVLDEIGGVSDRHIVATIIATSGGLTSPQYPGMVWQGGSGTANKAVWQFLTAHQPI